jgi:FlaA1/EpsC-like NDP-sugar epimerase
MLRWYDAHGVSTIYNHLQYPGRTGMTQSGFTDAAILVVGGAGFVGSALVRRLLVAAPRRM